MSRKSLIEKEKHRRKLVQKYLKKRKKLKLQIKQSLFLEEKFTLHRKLQKLPRNSNPTRLTNRCLFSGRAKGFLRDFGISRHFFRELAHEGLLPGVQKSSW
uniref:Small ribosomal subunit protein uS14c n=1 Tax=Ostreobium sp. HV05007bc TaxID=1940403 RepID=A0A1X9ZIB7_9CHLO|nr:ribosomal protein S14 [Ostreobium sp. HV05007bc]